MDGWIEGLFGVIPDRHWTRFTTDSILFKSRLEMQHVPFRSHEVVRTFCFPLLQAAMCQELPLLGTDFNAVNGETTRSTPFAILYSVTPQFRSPCISTSGLGIRVPKQASKLSIDFTDTAGMRRNDTLGGLG